MAEIGTLKNGDMLVVMEHDPGYVCGAPHNGDPMARCHDIAEYEWQRADGSSFKLCARHAEMLVHEVGWRMFRETTGFAEEP